MRAEDRMVSGQLRQVLNRLEEEEEEKQKALRQRVEEERGKLEATMGFSRAAAVAALAQEVELQNARKVEKARLKAMKSKPTPTLPELAEVTPESYRDRLLNENRRLAEEVIQLRARVHEMAAGAGAGAGTAVSDVARPGVAVDAPCSPPHAQMEELHNNTDGGDAHGGSLTRLTLLKSREAETRATDASTLSGQAGHINPTGAPTPSSEVGVGLGSRGEDGRTVSKGARRISSVEMEGEARAPSIKARPASADDGSCRAPNGGVGGIDGEEFRRLVEIEAATVLEELRANPPAAVKALLRVRQELDACAAAAVAMRKTASILLSTGLLPATVGDGLRDGAAAVSSSQGTNAGLHEVGTRSTELGKN